MHSFLGPLLLIVLCFLIATAWDVPFDCTGHRSSSFNDEKWMYVASTLFRVFDDLCTAPVRDPALGGRFYDM
jgi:hypothetical protein